jgi:hypothetical protein
MAEKLSGKRILIRRASGDSVSAKAAADTEGITLSGKKDRGTYRINYTIGPSVFIW